MKSILNDTNMSKESARRVLSQYHIKPTAQRLDIARITLYKDQHLSAEDVIMRLNSNTDGISRATVYNTLNLFVDKGLLRRVKIDSSKIYYDSKTKPHSHYFNVDTGEILDFEFDDIKIEPSLDLPKNTLKEGVDVVIRIKNSK